MANADQVDILIAIYPMGLLAERDYEAMVDLVEAKTVQGVFLATKDAAGETTLSKEAGESPLGDGPEDDGPEAGGGEAGGADGGEGGGPAAGVRKAVKGKVEGAKDKVHDTVEGVKGKVQGKAEGKLKEKVGKKLDEKLAEGSALMIAVYDHAGADSVALAIKNPMFASIGTVDGHNPKALKAALEEVQAGLPAG